MNLESQKILRYILDLIITGKFSVGDILPKEVDIAEKFNTNRMSAGVTLKYLEKNNLVSRKKRQGTMLNRIPSMLEARKLLNPYCSQVDIMVSINSQSHMHWNSTTVTNLEQEINTHGYNVSYHDLNQISCRDELAEYLERKIGIDSYALVLMPLHYMESKLLLDNYDLFLKWHDNVYLLDNGTEPVINWPCHRISQNPFLEGLCLADYLIHASERNIVFVEPQAEKDLYFVKERKRGLIDGLRRAEDGSIEFSTWLELDEEAVKRDNLVMVTPHTGGAVQVIERLSALNMKAGRDFKVVSMDNNIIKSKYNITSIAPPLGDFGTYLGELVCQESFGKSRGNRLAIEIYPCIIERESYIPHRI